MSGSKRRRRARCGAKIVGGKDGACRIVHTCSRPKGHEGPHGCWAHHPYLWKWVSVGGGMEQLKQDFSEQVEREVSESFHVMGREDDKPGAEENAYEYVPEE